MRIIAFIPARYHSTRFPGKPLARIVGKPMIQHVYERACSCPVLSGVWVATDDSRILDCVHAFGGEAVMTQGNHRSGTDRICEASRQMGLKQDDVVVNIQGDQPVFDPSAVTRLVTPFLEQEEVPMTTLRFPIREPRDLNNPNHVKVVTDYMGFALYFSRSPIPYVRGEVRGGKHYKHLGFYAFRVGFLETFTRLPEGELESLEKLEQLRALEHGFKIKVLETETDSIEVDVPEDIREVERVLNTSQTKS